MKYRSPDRFLAGRADVDSDRDGAEVKFEEDVSVGFVSRFGRSGTAPLGDDPLDTLDDADDVFGHLADAVGLPGDVALGEVGAVREQRYGPATVDLGALDAELSLTAWWADGEADPALVEASFRYGDDHEDYTTTVLQNGMALFEHLSALDAWRDPASPTKTAWIYEQHPEFCADLP
ncbi:MAG: hypothetical protein R3F59_24665 [Myxococcota bacterium]